MSEKELSQKLSVVLTERVNVPNATVYELVSYGRSPYTRMLGKLDKDDRRMVGQSMEQCGIAHKKNSLLSAISDGEKQKAFIAKALAQDTPVIVLDEPTAFLDLPARVEIIQLLRDVASRSGKTVILSTHDLDLALQMADKLWLLNSGGPLKEGTPEDLILQNAIQQLFQSRGLVFDVKTGQFVISHKHAYEIAVKGQGFEYFLLKRAFARNGIKVVPYAQGAKCWIEIKNIDKPVFVLLYKNNEFYETSTISGLVQYIMKYLASKAGQPGEEPMIETQENNFSCR
jgi:iron complex transport system ATP-binding protein